MKKENWLKILLSFAKPCRGKMTASVLFAVISVAGGFLPYLGVYQIIKSFLSEEKSFDNILMWSGVCLLGYILKVLFYGISTVLSHISAYTILEGLRLKTADKLMHAPLGAVQAKSIGNLKNTIVDRIESIEPPLAHMIPELSSNLLLPVVVIITLFSVDWRMGLASMATIPAAAIPMAIGMKTFNRQYAAYMKANDHVNSVIVEYVEGIEVVKTFNQTTKSYAKFTDAVVSFQKFTLAWFQSTWKSMNLTLSILPSTFLGTLPAGVALYISGKLAIEEVAFCLILAMGIVGPLMKAVQFINECKSMEYGVKDANEILHMEELTEKKQRLKINRYGVELKHVSFSYTGNKEDMVLKDISMSLPEGSFTALVGPSGGGKSTIARLIARFWDVTGGSIEIGGEDIKDLPLSQLSDLVSFVTQDNFLFDCSIKENIGMGRPEAAEEEVLAAARAAQCEEFITRLEKGFDTPAGEAGKQLSGGEKQRIAIARMILKNTPIVILDEATAFTDPENEAKIQEAILSLTKGKTLLVIAHRLSTIQNADQIVVLSDGKIIDSGAQKELLTKCELYKNMWESHIGARKWAVKSMDKKTYGTAKQKEDC
ncbi:ABC transporter ATP-binding protein [Anaerocolumna xylanovorans]|uniref:ATP-binding cassette, subfamily B n=1 Tax=Anaerocolumna xylanovorans DSM 12503 TaxID=1121345 RepID=A0A1M7YM21_9FIRM|nr:ABC transporter ATP-binding protein [Anaerocolumna xylanovorans]SHO53648.1 ATP-binding cassette, subfamily B [Anaerocolumna xylanovorans DSM 12503]